MKRFIYILLTVVFLLGCTKDGSMFEEPDGSSMSGDSDRVLVTLGVDLPEDASDLRMDENKIIRLVVCVFDENRLFVDCAEATDVSKENGTNRWTFKVKLHPSARKRFVHVIANWTPQDCDKFLSKWQYRDEREVIPSILIPYKKPFYDSCPMWARAEVDGIYQNRPLVKDLPLIRSMAKFTFSLDPAVTNKLKDVQYTICHRSRYGTLAPYNGAEFDADFLDQSYYHTDEESPFVDSEADLMWGPVPVGDLEVIPIYLFEQKNELGLADAPFIILKGKVQEGEFKGEERYFKLDLLVDKPGGEPEFFDLKRDKEYRLTLRSIIGELKGYPSFEEARKGIAGNNFSLSNELLDYPTLSDGVSKIEVEKTYYVAFPGTKSISFGVNYYPDYIHQPNKTSNLTIRVMKMAGSDELINHVGYEDDGRVTVYFNTIPSDKVLRGNVLVYSSDKPGLKRMVRFVARQKFDFVNPSLTISGNDDPDPKTGEYPQYTGIKLHLDLPDDYPIFLFPVTLKIYTNRFCPQPGQPLVLGYDKAKDKAKESIYYRYEMKSILQRSLDFELRANLPFNPRNEKIVVRTEPAYFNDRGISFSSNQ